MKKLLLFFTLIVGVVSTQAQDNPFAEYGYSPKIATLSQGQFSESFDNDTIVQIGSVLFNTKSKQIVAFVEYDTLYSEATLEPDIVSRWMSPDPLEATYPNFSPYSFAANSPIIFIDEGGQYIRLAFESTKAYSSYVKLVNSSLEGQFTVDFKLRTDDRLGNNFEVFLIPKGGDVSKLSVKGKAFYEQYTRAINAKEIVRQEVVVNDKETVVGSFMSNKLDIGDIEEFDKAGKGAATSSGALIHEVIEQLEKSKLGLDPSEWSDKVGTNEMSPEFVSSHAEGIKAENAVNGNQRMESKGFFLESNGTKTKQIVSPTSTGGVKISKSKIE